MTPGCAHLASLAAQKPVAEMMIEEVNWVTHPALADMVPLVFQAGTLMAVEVPVSYRKPVLYRKIDLIAPHPEPHLSEPF